MATTAAALIARARREIQHHFFAADAVRPDRALPFTPDSRIERRQFERMRARHIVREEKPGEYWIDVVAYDVDIMNRHRRMRNAMLVVIGALLVAMVVMAVSGGALDR